MTADAANSWTSISPDLTSGAPSTINAIAVSRSDSNVVYVGTDAFGTTSRIQRTTNALSSSPAWTDLTNAATLPTGRTISSIGVDRSDPDIVYVAFSGFSGCTFCLDNMGHVFRTSDGGTTWQDISGTGGTALPNAPANSILVDQQLPNTVFVGTDVGVFRTSDASQGTGTVWTTVGTGLPNVIVLGLSGRGSRIVRASTSGRSTWVIQDNNVPIPPGPVLSSVHPAIAVVGSATIPAVVVDGANFTGTSQVQWNGSSTGITTHFSGNANQMTIDIDTYLLASAQVANVTVADSSQIPNLSDKLRFTVVNPLPAPTFLSPISTNAGSSVTLTMTGSKFICGSNPTQVTFNGVSHNPDAGAANCTSTKIIATIPPAETGTPGNVFVSAVNPPPGGGGGPFVIGAFRFSINAVGGASAGFSPAALSFSNQATTTTSAAQTVTLTSTGGASLTTTSIAKTGTNSGDFVLDTSATGACKTTGQALAPTQSCTFAVTFAPTAGGLRSASITVADTGAGSPQVISLSGTGVVVNPLSGSISPNTVNFDSTAVSSTSSQQLAHVTNNGTSLLNLGAPTITGANSGDFAVVAPSTGTDCRSSATLAVNKSCVYALTFTPLASGTRVATLNIADNAPGNPHTVSLVGPATGGAAVSLSPANIPFGNQKVGTSSATTDLTITNNGSAQLNITSITLTGADTAQFSLGAPTSGTACPLGASNLAPSANCKLGVTFAPTTTGAKSANVSVADNATGSPQTVPLTGTGAVPVAGLAPANIAFGNQTIATSSATSDVTLSNTGQASMNITSITLTGTDTTQFALVAPTSGTACPLGASSLNAGASCKVGVQFAPTTTGAKSASVSVADDAAGSPQTVLLTGTGVNAPAPVVTLNPTSLAFGNQKVGTTSGALNATLTNTGNANLNITGVSITGTNLADFSSSGTTCTGTTVLTQNQSCTLGATFTPGAQGARAAAFTITDNASGSPHSLPLGGTSTIPGVGLSPANIAFGNLLINTTSATTDVTLTNSGLASLNISSITVTGTDPTQFTLGAPTTGTACPLGASSLAAAASCKVGVTFAPTTTGAKSANVSFVDDAAGSPQTVPLTGTGTAPGITLAPTNIAFGTQRTGTSTAATDVTITNSGTATLNITSITVTGTDPAQFTLGAPTTGTACALGASALTAGSSCKVGVKFAPTTTGAKSANMSVADDATGSPQTVLLTGTGTAPAVTFAAVSVAFGNQATGMSSATTDVTITNSGTAALNITSITVTGTDPTQFTLGAPTSGTACTLGASALTAGSSCKVGVKFSPTTTGAKSANVSVADDAAGSPQTVPLTGTGTAPSVALVPANIAFGNQPITASSTTIDVTLTNSGTGTLNITSITLTGTDPTQFALGAPTSGTACPLGASALNAGSNCKVGVKFAPTTSGGKSANVSVADDATGSPQTVPLTGTGTTATVALTPSPEPFGNQRVGTTSAASTITLTNSGNGAVTLAAANAVSLSGGNVADFAITGGTCANSVVLTASPGPGNTCTVTAAFTPSALGPETTTLTVTFHGGTPVATDNLMGTGVFPQATPLPTTVNFNNQVINTTSGAMTVTLTNGGTDVLHLAALNAAVLGGANAGDFAVVAGTTCINGATVNPGANCVINLTFTPSALNARTATLTITDDANPTTQVVALNGTGTNPTPTITSPLAPASTLAGGPAFLLTINGANFVAGATVNFGANPALTPTTITAGQILVTVPAADIAIAATVNVTVTNPAPGGGTSAAATFTINNPSPTITTLSHNSATAGGAAFTLTVNGTNFVSTSVVNFNG